MTYQELVALVAAPIAAQLQRNYAPGRDAPLVAEASINLAREIVDRADRLTRPEDESRHD